jgi:anti-sigma-K factor RskA
VDLHELTAAYALDALDAHDRDAYEAHLAHCARCREELAELADTTAALAFGVRSPAPPPELRARILDAAGAERANVVPLPARRTPAFRVAAAAAAVAACVAVGLGAWSASLSHSLDAERSARAAEARAMAIYTDPAAAKIPLHGRTGTLAVDRAGRGALVVRRLPAASPGMTYEAWVIAPGVKPIPAGTFAGGDPSTVVPLEAPIPAGATVAATIERAGGVDAPTAAPILTART